VGLEVEGGVTTPSDDPLAPFRTKASPEQRAACLHPSDDRVPLSGDGWLCCLCGADCARPDDAPAELTAERLDELDRLAREAHGRAAKATVGPWEAAHCRVFTTGHVAAARREDGILVDVLIAYGSKEEREANASLAAAAREDIPVLSAAVLALSAEVRRLRSDLKMAPGQVEDPAHAARLALAEPDEEGDCLRCHRTMVRPDRSEGEEAGPLCHPCAQAVLPMLAGEVERILGRGAPAALDDIAAIEAAAREDKAIASRATPPPWKWWTANSVRELHVDGRNRTGCVAYGQQHPHDRVIDIAIDESDMALIERAVNGLEKRADALLRLAGEVRRLREENARMRPVVEAAKAWCDTDDSDTVASFDSEMTIVLALDDYAKASVEPPRAEEERSDG
jgi:hypothetical protein